MKIKVVKFEKEKNLVSDFLGIPKKLYPSKRLTQNYGEEKELLLDRHVFSKYFDLTKFVAYEGKEAVGRAVLVEDKKNNKACYFGMFECTDDEMVAKKLFAQVEMVAKEKGYKEILGPVSVNFWMSYRLKIDNFDLKPYFGEPYNMPYYQKFIEESGFKIHKEYLTNFHDRSLKFSEVKKYNNRYKSFRSDGYKIVSPKRSDREKVLGQIHKMISDLYSDFPVFSVVNRQDFVAHFSSIWPYVDLSLIKIAYFKGKPAGFIIGYPNYGSLLYKPKTAINRIKTFLKRVHSSQQVTLYLGVYPEHSGLSKALVRSLIARNLWKFSTYISGLILKGKITAKYSSHSIVRQSNYVLMRKKL